MGNLLKISKQTIFQLLGKVVTTFCAFVILGILARSYGEGGVGIYTLTLTYLSIFYLLADFGFNAHVLKEDTEEGLNIYSSWKKLLGTRIIWSTLLIIIAVGLLPFLPFATIEFSESVMLGCFAILCASVFVTCNLIFQSKLRYDLSVVASIVGSLTGLFLFLAISPFNFPIQFIVFPHMLSWIILCLVALLLLKRFIKNIAPSFDLKYTKHLFLDSWPIAATLALNVVYFRLDSFLLAYFRNASEVGVYNIAFSIFQTALVIPAFIMNAYYPMMLKSLKQIKIIGLALFILAAMGTGLTMVMAPYLVELLTGGGFYGATQSLQILSLGFPAFFLSSLMMWILVTKNRYKTMLAIYGVGLLVNVSLNLIYIPEGSFLAASWITAISEYLILILQIVSLRR